MGKSIYVKVKGHELVQVDQEGKRLSDMALQAMDAGQAAEIERLKPGKIYRISIVEDRSTPMHRMIMSLFSLLGKALSHGGIGDREWDTEEVKEMAKLVTGYHRIVPLPKIIRQKYPRAIGIIPKSMAFNRMTHEESLDLTNRFMNYVAEEMAPWLEDAPEYNDICQIVGKINYPEDYYR